MSLSSPSIKERKCSQSASCKIDSIVRQLFMPMLSMPTPSHTSFLAEDSEDSIVRQVSEENPSSMSSEADFVSYMVVLYRKFQGNLGCLVQPCTTNGALPVELSVQLPKDTGHL